MIDDYAEQAALAIATQLETDRALRGEKWPPGDFGDPLPTRWHAIGLVTIAQAVEAWEQRNLIEPHGVGFDPGDDIKVMVRVTVLLRANEHEKYEHDAN